MNNAPLEPSFDEIRKTVSTEQLHRFLYGPHGHCTVCQVKMRAGDESVEVRYLEFLNHKGFAKPINGSEVVQAYFCRRCGEEAEDIFAGSVTGARCKICSADIPDTTVFVRVFVLFNLRAKKIRTIRDRSCKTKVDICLGCRDSTVDYIQGMVGTREPPKSRGGGGRKSSRR